MKIRSAAIDDAPAIARAHVTSWHETYLGILPDAVIAATTLELRAEQWSEFLGKTTLGHFVAEIDLEIVGFVSTGKNRDERFASEYPGELLAMYVLKKAHGCGVGRALFEAARISLLERGFDAFLPWVAAENLAAGFFERLGGTLLLTESHSVRGTNVRASAYGWRTE